MHTMVISGNAVAGKICLMASLISFMLHADLIELSATWTFGYNFNSGEAWVGGEPAAAGNDYLVSQDRQLQIGTGSAVPDVPFQFPGDSLIIGDVNGAGGVLCHGGAADITIRNLVLAKGRYWSYYTWGYSGTSKLRGAATVVSSVKDPFTITLGSNSSSHKGLDWYMPISGDVGSCILFSGSSGNVVMNMHSGSPNYRGSMHLSGELVQFGIASSDSLGGKMETFNEKALVIRKQATLTVLNNGVSLASSDNRAIYVESTGGNVKVPSNMSMTIGWPISGEGVLTKIGAGTLYLSNEVSVAAFEVAEGAVAASPGTTVALSKVRLNGGALGAGIGCGILAPSSVEVANGGRIPVKILDAADVGAEIPFLTAKKGTFGKEDFYVCAGAGSYGAPFAEVRVSESGEDDLFSLVVVPVVETDGDGVNNSFYATEGTHWSDSRSVHSGAAYLVSASSASKTFQDVTSTEVPDYVFPGQSLTLAGVNSATSAKLSIFSETFEGNLRFYNGTKISFGRTLPVIKGNMEVNTTAYGDNGMMVTVNAAVTATVESVVSGAGWMYFNNYSSAGTVGTIEFTATNTYTGGMHLYGGTKFVCLRISDERNLGVNPVTFNENALLLQKGGAFHPKGSVTIDDPNRGIKLNAANWITTDEGETTTIASPVSVEASSLYVNGGGTLFFGGVLARSGSSVNNVFTVENGFLKGGSANTFDVVKVVFSENGGLAADRVTDSSDSRSIYGTILSNPDTVFPAKLKVRIDYGDDLPSYGEPVPFLTVPEAVAQSLGDNVEFVDNLERGRWYLVRDDVTVDGKAFVWYSARYEKGFAVILR